MAPAGGSVAAADAAASAASGAGRRGGRRPRPGRRTGRRRPRRPAPALLSRALVGLLSLLAASVLLLAPAPAPHRPLPPLPPRGPSAESSPAPPRSSRAAAPSSSFARGELAAAAEEREDGNRTSADSSSSSSIMSALPTCLCPRSCDLRALSRVLRGGGGGGEGPGASCLQAIYRFRRRRGSGELFSCGTAVLEGYCGPECLPGGCREPGAETRKKEEDQQQQREPRGGVARYEGVAVVTKVMGPEMLGQLQQMLCLFGAAYNSRRNYDVVVFTTLPWAPQQVEALRSALPNSASARLVVETEGPPLDEVLGRMSPEDRERLHRRCGVDPRSGRGDRLTWYHRCAEDPGAVADGTTRHEARLSYAWQAEFRALHLWNSPALAKYRYMLWMDSDALCTREWTADPVRMMVENGLVLLFDNIPGDHSESPVLLQKIREAYDGRDVCDISLSRDGSMRALPCGRGDVAFGIPLVHGFLHVTDLDFYRGENATRFLRGLLGPSGGRFSREWDDQVAVTVPAAMDAPRRAWDLRSRGARLGVFHNGLIDGKRGESPVEDGSYATLWNATVRLRWPEARVACDRFVVHSG